MNTKSKPDLSELTITVDDVRLAGYCVRGVRRWFEGYDLDFRAFIENGMDAKRLLATGDAAAHRVVEMRLEREE
jgi:hypothetical protein